MIAPGTILTDAKRRWTASVHADGSIERDGEQGSIHKMGAAAQGLSACNGWTFWHVEQEGKLVPIDVLRQQHVLILD
jgi:modification methylase